MNPREYVVLLSSLNQNPDINRAFDLGANSPPRNRRLESRWNRHAGSVRYIARLRRDRIAALIAVSSSFRTMGLGSRKTMSIS